MYLDYTLFLALTPVQQDQYVHTHGKLLAQRWHENYSIELYDLGSFYCEQWLEQECLQLPQYRAFAMEECLELYPPQMQLLPY